MEEITGLFRRRQGGKRLDLTPQLLGADLQPGHMCIQVRHLGKQFSLPVVEVIHHLFTWKRRSSDEVFHFLQKIWHFMFELQKLLSVSF